VSRYRFLGPACTATHARRPLLFVFRVGGYVVASKGQTLVIHKAPEDKAPQDKAETAADGKAGTAEKEETAAVAFFRAASEIVAFDVSEPERSHITVLTVHGQVLQLQAAVLLT